MSKKFLIIGATGAVGSSLVKLIKDDDRLANQAHLVGKNEDEVSKLSEETGFNYTIADVLESNFLEKLEEDLKDVEIYSKNLFSTVNNEEKRIKLMKAIDYTNAKYGRHALSIAQAGIKKIWITKKKHSSKIDTASFQFLPTVRTF